ncbi:MAG: type IV pilus twitching motility protein PilT [bacterium]
MANLIDKYLRIAVKQNASDLHLIVDKPPLLRIDGQLIELENEAPLTSKTSKEIIYPIMTPLQRDRFEVDRELDLSYEIKNLNRYRVNLHFERDNVGLVARVIPTIVPSMEEIMMPQIGYDLTQMKDGLILLTGPTGCGKSTTLASMIDLINNQRAANIITLEDPIEFSFKSEKSIVKQRQLGSDIISFSEALKHIVRQDPNVIMVGEMRDLETISSAITLAETGHLVLATLHTYNAAQTIDRIIDIFPSHQQSQIRMQISMTLNGIISQRLIPKVGGGRIAVREILINTPATSNLIRENKISQIKTVIQTGSSAGMTTMDQDLKRLYEDKLITKETAMAYLLNPDAIK